MNPHPPFPLWHQLGGGSSIQTWALPLCSQQSFCEKTKGGEENKLGVTSWGFIFVGVVKSWGQSVDSWEANRKLSQAVPLLKKGEKKKEKRSLWYCYEVNWSIQMFYLKSSREGLWNDRDSQYFCHRRWWLSHCHLLLHQMGWMCQCQIQRTGAPWWGRRASLAAAGNGEMGSASTYRIPASV